MEIKQEYEELAPLLDHDYCKPYSKADNALPDSDADEEEVYVPMSKIDTNLLPKDPLAISNPSTFDPLSSKRKLQFLLDTPYDYFREICTDELLDLLVDKSNEQAENNETFNWEPLSRTELLVAIGLYLHTGTIKMQKINEYWSNSDYFDGLVQTRFPRIMDERRFMDIMNSLFYCDETEVVLDKVLPVLNFYNQRIDQIYAPPEYGFEAVLLMVGCLDYRKCSSTRYKYIQLNMLVEPKGIPIKFFINNKSVIENPYAPYENDLKELKQPQPLKWMKKKVGVLAEIRSDLCVDSLEDNKVHYIEQNVDLLFSYYPIDIPQLKCHQKIGLHVFHLMLMSSFHFYNFLLPNKSNLHEFRLKLIQTLTQLEPTKVKPKLGHFPICNDLGGFKKVLWCMNCAKKVKRVTTSYYCSGCSTSPTEGLCITCFKIYHDDL